ncbi:MAG TPA: hypothetical protein VGH91_10985 [Gammaproteobacteria bacterium]
MRIRIDPIRAGEQGGIIGLCPCPGRHEDTSTALERNARLERDVREIKLWRPKALVSAILDEELQSLSIQNVGAFATRAGLWWFRVPIPEGKEPDERFWMAWPKAAPTLLDLLRRGEKVVVHSANGYGRSSLVAACLLVEMGFQPDAALVAVRAAQPNAISEPFHEIFVRRYLPRYPEHTRMRS